MPHSSGGGSHHRGSHRSSHRSGSHSSSRHYSRSFGSASRIGRKYFQGSRRYRYRHFGRTHYVYSTDDPRKRFSPLRLLIGIIYIPFIAAGIFLLTQVFPPKYAYHDVVIKDEANVLGNSSHLMDSLEKFHEKSGVTPAVITVRYDLWDDLEDYAYDRYIDEFEDEMHWLIVYSEKDDRSDWQFEGMQGNDTDNVLTLGLTSRFNDYLYDSLERGDKSVGDSIADAFDSITSEANGNSGSYRRMMFIMALVWFGFIFFHAYFMLGLNELKYRKAVPDPDENEQRPAPDAGAAASPIYYTPDEPNGRICPSCGMTCAPDDRKCPVCGQKL